VFSTPIRDRKSVEDLGRALQGFRQVRLTSPTCRVSHQRPIHRACSQQGRVCQDTSSRSSKGGFRRYRSCDPRVLLVDTAIRESYSRTPLALHESYSWTTAIRESYSRTPLALHESYSWTTAFRESYSRTPRAIHESYSWTTPPRISRVRLVGLGISSQTTTIHVYADDFVVSSQTCRDIQTREGSSRPHTTAMDQQ
jgi:hypothetical protein